jgi:endonuclease G
MLKRGVPVSLLLALVAALFESSWAQQPLLPATAPGLPVVHHGAYSLQYDEEHEQAAWVAYTIRDDDLVGGVGRTNDYRSDPAITTGSAALADYKRSGFDRGHLAPAAVMKRSSRAMSESFFLSNISPQVAGFNRGIWKRLEARVRDWTVENQELHVVTGPVLRAGLRAIGPNQVSVPELFYKVILDYEGPELKALGFILPNQKASGPLSQFAVSVDAVERLTGIDFFPGLPDSLEDRLEAEGDIGRWALTAGVGRPRQARQAPLEIAAPAAPAVLNTALTVVYRTKTGKKYHQDGCRYLKRSKAAIELTDAKRRGLTACSVCRPPK